MTIFNIFYAFQVFILLLHLQVDSYDAYLSRRAKMETRLCLLIAVISHLRDMKWNSECVQASRVGHRDRDRML